MTRRLWTCLLLGAMAGCADPRPALVPFPSPPDAPRLILLGRLDEIPIDPPPPPSLRRWLTGEPPFPAAPLRRPQGIAARGARLYVCDPPAGSVVVFDFASHRTHAVGVGKPVAVALRADGTACVADAGGGRIVLIDADLRVAGALPGPQPGFRPVALAVFGETIFVADAGLRCVWVRDGVNGDWKPAREPRDGKKTIFPAGVCVAGGRVWLSDALSGRLLYADPPLDDWTEADVGGALMRPRHLACGADGTLFVADAARQSLQVRDPDGRLSLECGEEAALGVPTGVCVSRELLGYYRRLLPPAFDAEAVVFVTTQAGPPGVSVFACAPRRSLR